jgi:hypothetical protein
MPEDWLRFASPALLAAVLGVILIVGWSGIVSAGSGKGPEEAAASTKTVAKVHAKLPARKPAPGGLRREDRSRRRSTGRGSRCSATR